MRRCALFIRCMLVHSLYMCISHANSFFFNQPTKYRRQSGARWSTTVRTIVVIIVLYHSSYPLEHPLFSLVLFVCRWPNNTRYICMCSLLSISNSWPLWAISFFFYFFLDAHSHVKIRLMTILICIRIHTSLNRQYNRNVVDRECSVTSLHVHKNKKKETNRSMVDVFSSPSISIRQLINETV
jgi:hypothetical protein